MTRDDNPYQPPRETAQPAAVNSRVYDLVVGISFVLLAISLANDAFYVDDADNPRKWAPSFALFFVGWAAMLGGAPAGTFWWLANPALIAAWFMFSYRSTRPFAVAPALLSLFVSLSFMLCDHFPDGTSGKFIRITGYGAGYWLWIASITVMVVATVTDSLPRLLANRRRTSAPETVPGKKRRRKRRDYGRDVNFRCAVLVVQVRNAHTKTLRHEALCLCDFV